ncbi:polypeptide N-acetylgalactosaminyltransferase 13-like [Babylonia areolata]|uniref:polypeptide N-acetylgalactosaminyltransferase 13-like n=1 Tax=Babylonia areolata TaxID=304850 RepID=UPI003FD56AC5
MRLAARCILLALTAIVIVVNLLLFLHTTTPTTTTSTTSLWQKLPERGGGGGDGRLSEDHLRNRLYRNVSSKFRAQLDLMPKALRELSAGLPVTINAEEFRANPWVKTGNPLIDTYGGNDPLLSGEMGRGVTFVGKEKRAAEQLLTEFNLNVMASDVIPLNRVVPDSRLDGCQNVTYDAEDVAHLPTATIIVPFYNEWPSVLLRTVYSIVNRTPRSLLQEILLVDDCSSMEELKEPLEQYINDHFPRGLVRLLRMPAREGLIRTRMKGWAESKGEVVVFFDSHMEVNIDWLQPLLTEIRKDSRTVPMAVLDYVDRLTLEYKFRESEVIRYGFNWQLIFFETYFRNDQIGPRTESARPGTMMVGAAFAMDRKYFGELGGYDTDMKVWGGENLEMAWRVWMCGGRLVHVPCSHLGHIPRPQPYTFPKGRHQVELFNYKRAVMVWMDKFKEFVLDNFPEMKDLDAGDLTERYALRERLQCKNFTWYLDNVWPELAVYNRSVTAWGSLVNRANQTCLDNHYYLFQPPAPLFLETCHYHFTTQGFSLTKSGLLRTTLQCVVVKNKHAGQRPQLEDCITGPRDQWVHTPEGHMVHTESQLCLDVDAQGPVMTTCSSNSHSQLWSFTRSA